MRGFQMMIPMLLVINANAQEFNQGDSAKAIPVLARMNTIYNNSDSSLYYMTAKGFQKMSSAGCRIDVHLKQMIPNRIITFTTMPDGIMGAEYWIDSGKLIFVYQSFECFEETQSGYRWTNWKGLHGWESRYYFVDQHSVFEKHSGISQETRLYNASDLLMEYRKLVAYIQKKRSS